MQDKRPFLRSSNLSQNIPDGNMRQDGLGMLGQGTTVRRGMQLAPPPWDQRNVSDDQVNYRTLSVSMDRLDLELNPPEDRYVFYLIL